MTRLENPDSEKLVVGVWESWGLWGEMVGRVVGTEMVVASDADCEEGMGECVV